MHLFVLGFKVRFIVLYHFDRSVKIVNQFHDKVSFVKYPQGYACLQNDTE